MPRDYQPSFTGGEIAPGLWARADLARYHTSLALCRNWIIHGQGGISTRPGLEFVYSTGGSQSRLIPFEFNTDQTYVLVFTHLAMRVIKDGGIVLNANKAITNVTTAGVITSNSHGYSNGDEVYISGTGTSLDGRFFTISSVATNTFATGTATTASTTGTVARVYKLVTPWPSSVLFQLNFTQSNDVLTVVHKNYAPRDISRTDHDAWTITALDFSSELLPPENVKTARVGYTNANSWGKDYRYVITSANDDGDESAPTQSIQFSTDRAMEDTLGCQLDWDVAVGATYYNVYKEQALNSGTFGFIGEADARPDSSIAILEITDDNPAKVKTVSAHGLNTGDSIYISGIDGEAEYEALNNFFHIITKVDADEFTIGRNTTGATNPHTSVWWNAAGVIRTRPGFTDFNLGPDISRTPPIQYNPFNAAAEYPMAVTYYQQRRAFGGSINKPQTFWLSRSGDYDNMDYSRPRQGDDSIEVALSNQQVNEIRHLLPLTSLIAFTSGGEWAISPADDSGVLKPANVMATRQSGHGCSTVRPLEVGGGALFVQNKSARVRSLNYSLQSDKQVSGDLSVMAEHLFQGYTIVDWCYAEEPYSMVWAVRSDGALLSMTYMPDQEIWGWVRHSTNGSFKSVCTIGEGGEDAVYATVARTVGGSTKYFVERMKSRKFPSLRESFCVDAGLTRRGPVTSISAITNAAQCTVTSTAHGLSTGDNIYIRDVAGMVEVNNTMYRVEVVNANSFKLQTLDSAYVVSSDWDAYTSGGTVEKCLSETVTNLWHLEGRTLVALVDGNVVQDLVVTNGTVTLPVKAHLLHIGLQYNCDVQTLPVDLNQNPIQASKKAINRVSVRVDNTRGLMAGKGEGALYEMRERAPAEAYSDIDSVSGIVDIDVAIPWSTCGQVYIRQSYPLPATILSIIPEVTTSR